MDALTRKLLLDAVVGRMRAEIELDIALGHVPHDVVSFGDLHDHVDANCYGGFCHAIADDWIEAFGGRTADETMPDAFVHFFNDAQDAVDAPRFHHQWKPDRLYLEEGISPDTVALLKARGHAVEYSPGVVLARVEAILIDAGWLQGAADPRWVGKAAGY